MREILFKGKRVDTGEWVKGFYLELPGVGAVILNDNGYAKVIPESVGQYTGLTDKNRKKIFESDIVRITTGIKGYKSTYHSVIQKVKYYADGCGIAVFYPFDNSDMVEAEVIGNIYDNPELLGV